MPKIGLLTLCHTDYICQAINNQRDNIANALRDKGVDVVYSDTLCDDFAKASAEARRLIKEDVEGVIFFLGSWIECPTARAAVREMEHLPMCLFGFPMYEENGRLESTGAYVSYAMFKGVMDRVGYAYKGVLGNTDDPAVHEQLLSFCVAASASERMKRTRIGLVGYTSMSIYTGTFDHVLLRAIVGPEVEQMDSYTLINMAEAVSDAEVDEAIDWLKARSRIRTEVTSESLRKAIRLYVAMKKTCNDKALDAFNIKCQYEFSKEYKAVPCVPASMLADSGVVSSCEGDMMLTVSMTLMHYLSGAPVSYGDSMNNNGNVVKFSSCGFNPFSFGTKETCEVRNFMPHPGFTGIQTSFVLRPGRVTVMRLVEDVGSYHIVYMTGEGLETELRQGYMPALDVRLDGDVQKFLENLSGQHYAIVYGDISDRIEDYARIMGFDAIRI